MTARLRPLAVLLALAPLLALPGCGGSRSTQAARPAHPAAVVHARPALPASVARVRGELHGIAQHGLVLGRPSAPVTIIEYASLACSPCAAVHRSVVPVVIDRYVRNGAASLEFRTIADSPRSNALAFGAYAASLQRRGWDFIQLAYLQSVSGQRAGREPSTGSSAELVAALGLDVRRWHDGLRNPEWPRLIDAAISVLKVARFAGDPVFLVRRPGQRFIVLTQPTSVGEFAAAIAKAQRTPA